MEESQRLREYDSAAPTLPLVREFAELVRYRDLLVLMIVNIAKSRYSRSVLGVVWTLMNPLLHMAVLTIAFANLFRSSLPNYPVYVLCGLVCWTFFTNTTVFAMNSLVWGGGLLKRIYIPRTIFATAAVGNGLITLSLSLVPLVVVMAVYRHPWNLSVLWMVPIAILLLAVFTLGIALAVSALAFLFTDVVEIYQVLLQVLFFLAPIMYPVDILPAWAQAMMPFNPMYHLVEMFRSPLYAGQLPPWETTAAALVSSGAALLVGWVAFARRADELAYRL